VAQGREVQGALRTSGVPAAGHVVLPRRIVDTDRSFVRGTVSRALQRGRDRERGPELGHSRLLWRNRESVRQGSASRRIAFQRNWVVAFRSDRRRDATDGA